MRVVVDAQPLVGVRRGLGPTGVGRWARSAIRGLAAAAPDWSIDLVVSGSRFPDASSWGANVSLRSLRLPVRLYRGLRVADALFVRRLVGPADAMLGTGFLTFRGVGEYEFPVVHDLAHLRFPASVSRGNRLVLTRHLAKVVARAARVITVSECVRDEIARHFALDPSTVGVVPGAVEPMIAAGASSPPPSLDLPERYLLFVGTLEPRKNLAGLLDAYKVLVMRRPDIPPLVVVGGRGWGDTRVEERLRDPAVAAKTVMLGYVDDATLRDVYRGAAALVFPSFYEGFGLPLIEAMAAGCPVVASGRGAIREIADEAALLIDPDDIHGMADAIERILVDEGLRARLTRAGAVRAGEFTWTRAGEALKIAIESAMKHQEES